MGRHTGVALYVLALIAIVVGVDVLFFRHRFWERLTAPAATSRRGCPRSWPSPRDAAVAVKPALHDVLVAAE
jgi:hypothetical protein